MGWDADIAIGKLMRFWWWCVDYAEDGDLRKHSPARLAVAVGLQASDGQAFFHAMVKSGWIDEQPHLRVHDWWDYIGPFLRTKYRHHSDKWQKVKDLYVKDSVSDAATKPNLTKPNLTLPNLTKRGDSASRFAPPTIEQIREYCSEKAIVIDFEKFHSYYSANGWKVGRNPMKDWKAAVRNWYARDNKPVDMLTDTQKGNVARFKDWEKRQELEDAKTNF